MKNKNTKDQDTKAKPVLTVVRDNDEVEQFERLEGI